MNRVRRLISPREYNIEVSVYPTISISIRAVDGFSTLAWVLTEEISAPGPDLIFLH
jgi:hypothetical protein